MIEFDVKVDPGGRLDRLDSELHPTRAELEEVADWLIVRILERTSKGRDSRGRFFKRYDKKYAASKAKSGRSVSPVNLSYTGAMLAGITRTAHDDHVVVHFTSATLAERAGFIHAGTSRMPARRFFEAGKSDLKQIADMLAESIASRI